MFIFPLWESGMTRNEQLCLTFLCKNCERENAFIPNEKPGFQSPHLYAEDCGKGECCFSFPEMP
jgi:hypothetical protein